MSHATEEETNFGRVCQVTVELFPQALRDVLQAIKDPATLPPLVKLNGNYNTKLSADQRLILSDLPTDGNYQRCDTSMLCILYRNLPGVKVKPTNGWGKPINSSHVSLGDDVERIRESRNHMFGHAAAATLTNSNFAVFMQAAKDILSRFDNLHGGYYPAHPGAGIYVKRLDAIETKVMDYKAYNDFKQEMRNAKAVEAQIQTTLAQIQAEQANLKQLCHTSQEDLLQFQTDQANLKELFYTSQTSLDQFQTDQSKLLENQASLEANQTHLQKTVVNLQNDVCEIMEKDMNAPEEIIEPVDQVERCASFTNDETSHYHRIKNTSWYNWGHHSENQNPSDLLHHFKQEHYIPQEVSYKLYESGATQFYSADDLNARFLDKFRTIFSVEMEQQPWLFTNLHADCVDDLKFYEFCRKIEEWAFNRKRSFLFIDYRCEENLAQLNFNLELLKRNLMIGDEDSRNRVLLYLADKRMIFNIRFVSCDFSASQEAVTNTIIDGIHKGQDDLKLFSALYMNLLKDSGICFTNLVAVEGVSAENLAELQLCANCIDDDLIIPCENLRDPTSLAKKFDSLISRHTDQFDKMPKPSTAKETYESLASRIWASLCVRDVHLPILSARDQDTLVRIYLNKDQRHFLHSKDEKVILRGGYGSGKSILAQEKFKERANGAGPEDQLYYIIFTNDTVYTSLVRSYIHESLSSHVNKDNIHILNVDEYAKKYMRRGSRLEVSKSVSKVLMGMNLRHDTYSGRPNEESKVNVVIDELDGSILTEEEAKDVKTEADKLDYVLIVMQSMEVSRKTVVKKRLRRTSKTEVKGHNYLLTGMKLVTLDMIMRNCTKINELSRVAVKLLKRHRNQYFERAVSESSEEGRYSLDEEDIFDVPLDNYNLQGNFYHCAKILRAYSSEYTGIMFESKFEFPGEWSHGHSIEGRTPRLIYPFSNDCISYETVNNDEMVKRKMFFTMKNIINVEDERRIKELAIIAFDPIDAQFIFDILSTMKVPVIMHCPALQLPSVITLDELKDSLESHILITDHIGARGMEFKQLLVVFNPNEIFLQQYLIEAFTRAIYELSFLLIFKNVRKSKENNMWMRKNICNEIIKKWIDKDLVVIQEVVRCKLHKTEDSSRDVFCPRGHYYNIHPWHENFNICKDMNEIRELYVDPSMAKMELEFHIHNHVKTLGGEQAPFMDLLKDMSSNSPPIPDGQATQDNERHVIGWSRLTEDADLEEDVFRQVISCPSTEDEHPQGDQSEEKEIISLERENVVKIGGTTPPLNTKVGFWNNDMFRQELRNLRTPSFSCKTDESNNSAECDDDFRRLGRFRSSTNLTKTYTMSKDDAKQLLPRFKKLIKIEESHL